MTEWNRKMTLVLYFDRGHLVKKKKEWKFRTYTQMFTRKVITYNIYINLFL